MDAAPRAEHHADDASGTPSDGIWRVLEFTVDDAPIVDFAPGNQSSVF